MLRLLLSGGIFLLLLTACQSGDPVTSATVETDPAPASAPEKTPAERVLAQAVAAHGGSKYDQAHYQFMFRDKTYTFRNDNGNYHYTMTQETEEGTRFDQLANGVFNREVAGESVQLTDKETASGTEALNSVIYFATLPYKLQDPAVNLLYAGTDTINGSTYDVLNVNFDQEGGGVDHDDNFRYWINQETHRMDYLAYDYLTNGGGVRFRSAFNPRMVDGVLFQDYVNYKAPVGTTLADLPAWYEAGMLEELSKIETEEVVGL